MTRRLVFTRRAEAQLGAIDDYISAKADPITAEQFVARIIARCEGIPELPKGGRPRLDLGRDFRSVPFERSATIVYRLGKGSVVISGIFYAGQNLSRHYRRRSD